MYEEWEYANQYLYGIDVWLSKNRARETDEKGITHILSVRNSLIESLKFNNSTKDLILCKYIKSIEDMFVIPTVRDMVDCNLDELNNLLDDFKPFEYKPQPAKAQVTNAEKTKKANSRSGRPKGSRNKLTNKKYNWVRDQYYLLKKKKTANTTKEHSKLIRSKLKTDAPEWWGKDLYRLETIIDIIKKQKWGD